MALTALETTEERRLPARREAGGIDRYNEVWDGVAVIAPVANNEHRDVQSGLAAAVLTSVGWGGPARVHAANVSDRKDDWEHNYRIPDLVVVLPGSAAKDCGTHWCGGPDFCVEIVSPSDRSRNKLEFYAGIGVRELLLIDRDPWALELYRLSGGQLRLAGRSDLNKPDVLASAVVPTSFRLVPGAQRPAIEVTHQDGVQRWLV